MSIMKCPHWLLFVLVKILGTRPEPDRIVEHTTDALIASDAQKSANLASDVIVIHGKPPEDFCLGIIRGFWTSANGAQCFLLFVHLIVLRNGYSKAPFYCSSARDYFAFFRVILEPCFCMNSRTQLAIPNAVSFAIYIKVVNGFCSIAFATVF